MKKIITAIGDSALNNNLKQNIYNNVIYDDIDDDEKLIEILKKDKIDFLFLHSEIVKNYILIDYIKQIRKIQKNAYIVIFSDREIIIDEIENVEIMNNKLNMVEINNILNKEINNYFEKDESKVIAISGCRCVGKSMFSTFFARNVEINNQKIILIDFDLKDGNIKNILRIKNKNIFKDDIEKNIIKYSENIDVLVNINECYELEEIDYFCVRKLIDNLRRKYDYIIIDTSSNMDKDYLKNIYYNSDKVLFLIEPNIIGVKKANDMLEIIDKNWKYSKEKINIVINKANIYQIDNRVMNELFPKYDIVGKISYSDKYNLMLNKNVFKKEINNEYKVVFKKLIF